jgi:hypothetical protein
MTPDVHFPFAELQSVTVLPQYDLLGPAIQWSLSEQTFSPSQPHSTCPAGRSREKVEQLWRKLQVPS